MGYLLVGMKFLSKCEYYCDLCYGDNPWIVLKVHFNLARWSDIKSTLTRVFVISTGQGCPLTTLSTKHGHFNLIPLVDLLFEDSLGAQNALDCIGVLFVWEGLLG